MDVLMLFIFICVTVFNFYVADSLKETTDTLGRVLFVGNMVAGCMNLANSIWYMLK